MPRASAARMHSLHVACATGLESVLQEELRALGLRPEMQIGGAVLHVEHSQLGALLARLNLALRSASRVLLRVARFHCPSFAELESEAAALPWSEFLAPSAALRFEVSARKSKLVHTGAIAERVHAAIAAQLPDVRNGGKGAGAQRIFLRLKHDRCLISIDSSGALLHQRGYRPQGGTAPLRETLAAAMLLAAGYDGHEALWDPFCGSATLPIEAAGIALHRPPGARRRFIFEDWPCAASRGYLDALAQCRTALESESASEAKHAIGGSDRAPGALEIARRAVAQAELSERITLRQSDAAEVELPTGPGLCVANPPYDRRLKAQPVKSLRALRTALPQDWRLALIAPKGPLPRAAGFDGRPILDTWNGGIRVGVWADPPTDGE